MSILEKLSYNWTDAELEALMETIIRNRHPEIPDAAELERITRWVGNVVTDYAVAKLIVRGLVAVRWPEDATEPSVKKVT